MRAKVVILVLLAALLAFGSVAQEAAPLKIGLLTDLSGVLAIYGIELDNGLKLGLLYAAGIDPAEYDSLDAALADLTIAGRPVEILVRDNASDPDTASQQARELIENEGVEILVGAPSSGVTLGLQQVAVDYDTILFAAPGASPTITGSNFNPNTFRVCRNTAQDSLALASYATQLGENWVILAADYDFGRASAAAYEATLAAFGVKFASEVIFAPLETTDFTAYLQQVSDSGADVLLPIWAGDTTIPLLQQIAEFGISENMAVIGALNSNDLVALSDPSTIGQVAPGVYHYTFPHTEANDWLVAKHVAVTEAAGALDYPDLFTECAFATGQALYAAVDAAGGDTLPASLIPQLEGMVFEGPKGTYFIRPGDHQVLVPMYVAQLDNLDSPEYAFWTLVTEVDALAANPPCLLEGDYAERCALNDTFIEEVVKPAVEAMRAEE
ncbi:MAG: substrate-binding domain-containing protein [Anaerolineae bacterium]|nr:MAG: extracellular ligand-binding receptor [Chloroflexi bacterium OLB13]MBW7878606.1 substrate-binding domain-containing protein [Anaerolineae bacterium]MEB2366183.1 substrate-binding domain-containing protein [Chloroflexota bacterium]GIK27689.1 MAG: ABC transporter substrate-binding protein [Chloroflexota bacterium]